VGEFVHENNLGMASENGVDVHFLEYRAFVFDLFSRNGFDRSDKLFDAFAAVGFNDADDHVFAAVLPADSFAQHAKGFADAGSVTEKKLENAAGLLRRGSDFQPLFRFLRQGIIFSASNGMPALE
jgi:hypothetical protein